MKDKVLILGGTEFVGRQLVEELVADATKEIYLFNRGKTNPDLFPNAHKIIGDRETSDVAQLKNYKWDYVIDFSSYFPKSLKNTLEQINRDVKRYVYISTISVYTLQGLDRSLMINEDFGQVKYTEEELIDPSPKTYGKRKVACEEILNEAKWLNKVILRPSVIYGKYDPTDRFYYWVKSVKEKEKVILADNGERKFSLTFADDLVRIIQSILKGKLKSEAYNCSTHAPMKMADMMKVVKQVLKSDCAFINVEHKELRSAKIALPFSFGVDILLDNAKLEQDLEFDFTSFTESVNLVVEHMETEEWKDCKIKIDSELERTLIANN